MDILSNSQRRQKTINLLFYQINTIRNETNVPNLMWKLIAEQDIKTFNFIKTRRHKNTTKNISMKPLSNFYFVYIRNDFDTLRKL